MSRVPTPVLAAAVLAALSLAGCNEKPSGGAAAESAAGTRAAATPTPASTGTEVGALAGEVVETMDAASYTYVKVRTPRGEVWAAGPRTTVTVGQPVMLPDGMLMKDFRSQSLGRSFPEIYFVSEIRTAGAEEPPTAMRGEGAATGGTAVDPAAGEHMAPPQSGQAVAAGTVARPDGGRTIAEIWAERPSLAGQKVLVRGKVVKATGGVMGRNWLHIQDGSAAGAQGDLTVTTSGQAAVGDVVLVEGTAAVDKDFGAGYRYDVIVEEATVTVEGH